MSSRFSLFPPVIKTLLILNVVVYVAQHWFLGILTVGGVPLDGYIIRYFALQSLDSGAFLPWQVLSYQFMHGDFFHLFFNMLALWMFGAELESLWGSRRFFVFYLLSGIGAACAQLAVSYATGSLAVTVGASGSINGVLLAFGFMFPDRPILVFPIFFPIPAKILVMMWLAIDLVSGLWGTDSVAHFAHLGGALCGYLLLKFGDRLGIFAFFERLGDMMSGRRSVARARKIYNINEARSTQETAPRQNAESWFRVSPPSGDVSQEEIDRILDKIARAGYNSLTDEEKRRLYEASRKM